MKFGYTYLIKYYDKQLKSWFFWNGQNWDAHFYETKLFTLEDAKKEKETLKNNDATIQLLELYISEEMMPINKEI